MRTAALVTVGTCIVAIGASAQVQTLGEISFTVPPGWRYEERPGRAAVIKGGRDGACIFSIYRSFPVSRDPDRDFFEVWRKVVRRQRSSWDSIGEHKSTIGYAGRVATNGLDDGNGDLSLYLLQAHGRWIPITLSATSRAVSADASEDIGIFVDGVRISPDQAQPTKMRLAMTDLAGEWHFGTESTVAYVSGTGKTIGYQTVAYGFSYAIRPDGTFSSKFGGFSNSMTVRDQTAGQVAIRGPFIIFRDRKTLQEQQYYFIRYQEALDGGTILTMLPDQYEPTNGNISMYGQGWIRYAISAR